MSELKIGNKKVMLDDEDMELVSRLKWAEHSKGGYMRTWHNGKHVLMHRLIMGAEKGQYVDHINGNKLDNRKSNLRLCTNSQNLANRGPNKNNSHGHKGLTRTRCGWMARIVVDRKAIYLGHFKDLERAKKKYIEAAEKHFGEFAHG